MRTGKSQIARRFNALTGVSYVSTDDLFAMLGVAAPSLKIGWDSGNTWQETGVSLRPSSRSSPATASVTRARF